ncbi:RHS repeat-associated core domain-containing protein [uncultured Thiobacillus sp.]|uniref:RHS repeat-associated core domain-containing protein n=2 Tax=Thiobacillus TaxID=919 RepID=UPI00262A2EE0|nr:RHS repeat-associated core domain-containing protein [uncultured Thiobacillus sp.]
MRLHSVLSMASLCLALVPCVARAEHVDPAPLSDEVIQYIGKLMNPGPVDPLPGMIRYQIDEAAALALRIKLDKDGQQWSSLRPQLEAKLNEIGVLRDEAASKYDQKSVPQTLDAKPASLIGPDGKKLKFSKQQLKALQTSPVQLVQQPSVGSRFDQIIQSMQAVLQANNAASRNQAVANALNVLNTVGGRNRQGKAFEQLSPEPTFRHDTPTKERPEDYKPASEPAYVAYQQRTRQNMYAFLGNTMLAMAPDPTPAEAQVCSYDPQKDLGENEEVQLNPEIRALAEKLGYSPVKIFQYVANEIAFEPYYGSLKGAQGTLVSKAGNSTDQASLLIALLRASNIPARYVLGSIQFDNNDPRLLRWLGAKTSVAAQAILAQGKIAPSSSTSPLYFNHVWVEACVPYGNYRGTGVDKTGHRWIPLDPSFKEKTYQNGIAVNVDFDYDSYMAQRTDGPDSLPHEKYQRQVEAYVKSLPAANGSNNTIQDVGYIGKQAARKFDILPASLPYKVRQFSNWGTGYTAETDTVPDSHRYKLEIITGGFPSTNPAVISMPGNVLKRMTLSFSGATPADQTVIDSALYISFPGSSSGIPPLAQCTNTGSIYKYQGYYVTIGGTVTYVWNCNVNMAQVATHIRLDGNDLAIGNFGGFWSQTTLQVFAKSGYNPSYHSPKDSEAGNWSPTFGQFFGGFKPISSTKITLKLGSTSVNSVDFKDKITQRDYYSLHANAFQTSDRLLKERAARLLNTVKTTPDPNTNLDETLGEFLHIAGLKYMRYISDAYKRIGEVNGDSGWSGNHIGLVSANNEAQTLLDLPFGVSTPQRNFLVDVPGGVDRGVDLSTGAMPWKSFLLKGYTASAYESYLWQENAKLDAVSTVRGVQYAREKGIEILTLTPDMCLPDTTAIDAELTKLTSNSDSTLNYLATDVSTIKAMVCSTTKPKKAILPRSKISYQNWVGTVYFSEYLSADGTQMEAGFTIGGGYHGGYSLGNYVSPIASLNTTTYGLGSTGFNLYNPTYNWSAAAGTNFTTPSILSSGVNYGVTPLNIYSGDPVNMVTGNMYHVERDLSIPGRGGLPFVFERSYNSRDAKTGVLGFGWTHSFNHQLKFEDKAPDGSAADNLTSTVTWIDGTGAQKFMTVAGTAGGVAVGATFTTPKAYYFAMSKTAAGYEIREKNGLTYTFEGVAGTVGQKAKLLSIRDRNGNTLTLAYNPDGTLKDVTDGPGRKLAFTYTSSRITHIDFKNAGGTIVRSHEYVYDGNDDLVAHKSPATLLDAVKNPAVAYSYYTAAADGANLGHAMKQYTLPRGNGMQFFYYANGKTFRHRAIGPGGSDLGQEMSFTYNDFRRETVQINERGLTRRFFFDADGNPLQIVEENGGIREYTYDPADPGKRLSKRDPMGYETHYEYDALGNVTRITNPDGGTVQFFDFNAYNQPQRSQDARGNWSLVRYDAKGNPTDDIRLKAGVVPTANTRPADGDIVSWTQHAYDANGNRTQTRRLRNTAGASLGSFSGGAGPAVATTYDANGLYPVAIARSGDKTGDGIDDAPDSETLAYDDQGRETRGIDGAWQVVQREYDSVDRVKRATDALGHWRDYSFDANGNLIGEALTVANARVDSRVAVYDDADRQIQVIDAAGSATRMEYDPAGNLARITDPDGYSATMEYDANNHVVAAADKAGNAVVSSLDLDGKPRNVVDPNGSTQAFVYYGPEKNGRLKQSLDPAGRATTYDYDAHGNAISVTDNLGRTAQTVYDELDRPIKTVGPAVAADGGRAPLTCMKYDTLGRMTELWAGSTLNPSAPCDLSGSDPDLKKQTTVVTNDFGWKVKETDPLGHVWTWSYDRFGNVTEATDAKNQKTQMVWGYGHQLQSRIVRDANGNVYRTETFTRNALGQPTRVEARDAAGNLIAGQETAFDAAHRVTRLTDLRPGTSARARSFAWSPGGMLNTMQDQSGARTDYLYDPVGNLIGIWGPNFDYLAFTHDAGGRLTEKWDPNGINSQYEWNPDNTLARLANRVAFDDSHTISVHEYDYDALGRRQTATDKAGSLTLPAQNDTYAYDALDNRTRKTVNGVDQYAIFDAANQLVELRSGSPTGALAFAFVYDANGNLTMKCEGTGVSRAPTTCSGSIVSYFTWNPDDQLIGFNKLSLSETYQYDHLGRRISKMSNGVTTYYRYNGDDIDAEYSATWSETARYVHGPSTDDPLMRLTGNTSDPSATAIYYHQDGIGSVVATSDQAGNIVAAQVFDAWGNRVQSTGSIAQYGYTGREPDQTGLIYYRARYYDPVLGRFISRDPAGMPDGVNRYAYVNNNPVNFTDPSGEFGIAGALGSMFLGGVIRGLSGEAIFDPRAIATDALLGVVGAGIVSKASRIYQGIQAGVKGSPQFARYIGNIGERAVGAAGSKSAVSSISGTAARRFPDKVDDVARTITEVKNKAVLSAKDARQIGDDVLHAASRQPGYQTQLYTRSSTDVSRVKGLIDDGSVVHKYLPGVADDGFRLLSPLGSGLAGAGFGQGTQSLYSFTAGTSTSPYSGGAQTGINPRANK